VTKSCGLWDHPARYASSRLCQQTELKKAGLDIVLEELERRI